MSDGPSYSPEMSLPPAKAVQSPDSLVLQTAPRDQEQEILKEKKQGIRFYKSGRFDISIPEKPNIPLNEGLHVKISDGHDANDTPKEVLARYLMAEGVAKELAESGKTPIFWSNTRLEPGQVVSVYGIDPRAEDRWRKPVDAFNRNVPEMNNLGSDYNLQEIQGLSKRYLPEWEQLVQEIDLFKNGVKGQDVNKAGGEGPILWENDNIEVMVIRKSHLEGFHLLVSPKKGYGYQRQWQTVKPVTDEERKIYLQQEQIYLQRTLEITAVAMGIQKLLGEGKGELHNSGNWNKNLDFIKNKGKVDLNKFFPPNGKKMEELKKEERDEFLKQRKAEKRYHRPDLIPELIPKPETPEEEKFNKEIERRAIRTGMHTHVYLPKDGGRVILPEMSEEEASDKGRVDVIAQWAKNTKINEDQVNEMIEKIGNGKLTKWLEENCRGRLISQAA